MDPIVGFGIANPTTSLSLSSILCLPDFLFNLLSVRKSLGLLIAVSFFPDHCVFQDLITKQIIGRGCESSGFYLLEPTLMTIPRPIACSNVLSPLDLHCCLGHPFLSTLKKLFPHLQHLSYFDCESCQFANHHHVSNLLRINKKASWPFELVHSDVWGPCPVVSTQSLVFDTL